jgi:ATP-dependent helicase HepA
VQDFIPGQRWVSSAELDMGLGTVLGVEPRTVTLLFPATGETRTYARESAPLSRVRFAAGDTLLSNDERSLKVEAVREQHGLLNYIGHSEDGQPLQFDERELSCFMQLNRPGERLFSGQIDNHALFELRYASWQHRNRLTASQLYGLSGCRTSLIPHQLYIAHAVASRYAPRVLLADEVGLGKTIEAGLILHQQLLTERARRVLVVVPASLLHQWLVEMLRRFNLFFSIFDDERYQTLLASDAAGNPFHSEQLLLCSLEFVSSDATRLEYLLNGDWDLLIVDEAHHLQWTPIQSSHDYQCIERLAAVTAGVLLLTATPEQLGRASHFARLRLLDASRFPDLESFIAEEDSYAPVANAIEHVLNDTPLEASGQQQLERLLHNSAAATQLAVLADQAAGPAAQHAARLELVNQLLDRHGTGRVLFRNTRAAVSGFPERHFHLHPLPLPAAYRQHLTGTEPDSGDIAALLCPEQLYASHNSSPDWTSIDPRVDWLIAHLAAVKPHKVLVICAQAATATALAGALYQRAGVHAAVFHEALSLVERDRAAAFFADTYAGTQVLVCSEIGSEGRNFQFAHQLVLFDLPLNPDLLEQRIGRLDRIGQQHSVEIHLPCLEPSALSVMADWYQRGLAAFEHTCPAGAPIYQALQHELHALLVDPQQDRSTLIEDAARMHRELNAALQRGRDRLLEYNSCRQPLADSLCAEALQLEDAATLADYLDRLFDLVGVNSRLHSEGCLIIEPGEHMLHPLPGLPDDGLTVTYRRDIALAFEDARYLSWEHPLVRDSMDMLLGSELGNCTVAAVKYAGVRPGTVLLECIYIVESRHQALRYNRHMPPTAIRLLCDELGHWHQDQLDPQRIAANQLAVDTETGRQVVAARDAVLRTLLVRCEQQAGVQANRLLQAIGQPARQSLQTEINRLRALAEVNPNVRASEIRAFELQLQQLENTLQSALPRLDAVRVLVAT